MKPGAVDGADVGATLEAIRRELARLGERVAALEAAAGKGPPAPRAAPPPPPAPPAEEISEEVLLVLSAAVAAFLGKRAPLRQIRLLSSAAWAQQGRVTIQASHALPVQHR
jgi:methylmalonyl-CoA carboxyltransferase large subunit